MHDHILRQMRDKIRANEYIVPANWFSSRLGEKPHDLRLLR